MENINEGKKQQLAERKKIAEYIVQKQKDNFCKNADMTVVEDKKLNTWVPKNNGCENPRRMGSAWCQECSDKFNNK